MGRFHQLKTNFVAGELDPRLLSRSDIKHYYNGAERVRNAIVLPQGGAEMRPGSKFIWQVPEQIGGGRSNVRLVEFQFNTEQTYLLVFHHLTITIFRNDELVATIASPYTSDDLIALETPGGDLISSGIYWTQSKDTLLIFHQDYPTRKLKRMGSHSNWEISEFEMKNIPRFDFGEDYTDPDEVGIDEVHTLQFPAPGNQGNWTAGDTFTLLLEDEESTNIRFDDNADVMRDRIQAALRDMDNTSSDGITVTHPSPAGTAVSSTFFVITFANEDGKRPWGVLYYRTISAEQVPTIDIVVAQKGQLPGEPVFSAARGYPRCGTFFQGRLWVAGTPSLPHWVWASRVGSESDFNSKLFADDYGIAVPADTDDVPAFTAIYAGRHLQIFSKSGEFYVPISDRAAITPGNVALRRTTSRGCKPGLRVYEVDGATHFVQRRGNALREMIFADAEQAYQTNNISLLSPHLMRDPQDFALRRSTSTTDADYEFFPNSDGTMTVFCTLRTQEVNAMALWKTAGEYRAAGVVLDDVYFAISRVVDGSERLFIEKMDHTMTVDCGLVGEASAAGSVPHLPGETIEHLLDGAIQQPVDADALGAFSFTRPAVETWQAGLKFAEPDEEFPGFIWLVKTLPLEIQLPNGSSFGKKRRVSRVALRLWETSALQINDSVLSFSSFGSNLLDQRINPYTGVREFRGLLGWDRDGSIVIGSKQSLPGAILGINFGVNI